MRKSLGLLVLLENQVQEWRSIGIATETFKQSVIRQAEVTHTS
jgi:hypothetical protein